MNKVEQAEPNQTSGLRSKALYRGIDFLVKNGLFILIGIVIMFYAIRSPIFLSYSNIKELLANSSPLLLIATGITFVILIAEIDLSVDRKSVV